MKHVYNVSLYVLIIICVSCSAKQQPKLVELYPIIPSPQEVTYGSEELNFTATWIVQNQFSEAAEQLTAFFTKKGIQQQKEGLKISFEKVSTLKNNEAYLLEITDKIVIKANTAKGAFYGVQTLKQLFRKTDSNASFPKINIKDWPAFKVRGFMHDTGRNFQSVDLLKEQLEIMAQYKYNVFHWHLTDNPGWRLESKKYPELQSEKATSRKKGKFYTQKDFKEILAFCKERFITVIPELDIPGHTEAFRKALGIKKMKDPRAKPILLDLFQELMNLADAKEMPYIHIGTDEVKAGIERVSNDDILEIMNLIKQNNREVVVWRSGITVKKDSTSINQLWAQHSPRKGHRFIDSRANYINHLDPFAGAARLFFQQPCRQPSGGSLALGGVLCAWPDNNIGPERDVLKQNPIYPSMLFYADAIWKGREKDNKEYWAKLPHPSTQEFSNFKAFENKVITHRNLFFKDKEFPYISQSETNWKVIGPFNHKGNLDKSFAVEDVLKETYTVDEKTYQWQDSIVGATVHLKHFFGFESLTKEKNGTYYAYTEIYSPDDRIQDFWVGFQGWSRSSRRGGPTPNQGQWHSTNPKIWVNNTEVAPPIWKQPNLKEEAHEIPFIDEDYFYRSPTKIQLKKGWNKVLLKIPQGGKSWKWMFTCTPVKVVGKNMSEVPELTFKKDILFD